MGQREPFRKRRYRSLRELWSDVRYLLSRRSKINKAMGGELLSQAFRERLMTVVTEVNDCRYCRSFHHQQALEAGVSREELDEIERGMIPGDAPEGEILALRYARCWAETDGDAGEEMRQRLLDRYGESMVEALHVILTMIRTGNLLGNSVDYILYQVSSGRWGNPTRRGS